MDTAGWACLPTSGSASAAIGAAATRPRQPHNPYSSLPSLQEVAVLATAIADALPLHTPYSRARGADGAGVGLPEASACFSHPSSPDDVEDEESAFGQLSAHLAAPPAAPPLDTSALWPRCTR